MNNRQMNRFAYNPVSLENVTRSRFKMPHSHKTTFNAGQLIPFKWYEVLAGDTWSLDLATVCKMTTPVFPVMDNAYLDVFFFFVPSRLCWEHNNEFYGENTSGPWESDTEYEIPQIEVSMFIPEGSFYEQLGLPLFSNGANAPSFDARPVRAYGLIWNEWFRDQNVSAPLYVPLGDATVYINNAQQPGTTWFDFGFDRLTTDWMQTGICLPVAKFHDFFTSALPQPQKGPAVTLPLLGDDQVGLPVAALSGQMHSLSDTGIVFANLNNMTPRGGDLKASGTVGTKIEADSTAQNLDTVRPINLFVPGSEITQISVNTLRQAFAMQRLFEKDARGGTRFREIIYSHFGVRTSDSRIQVPEFIGGKRVPISMTAVPQTSATNDISPQGNLAAYSNTLDKASFFTYSATEPGFIMGLCCVRTDQSYSQGIEKKWTRKRRYDFYWPVFANLGEQAIYRRELYVASDSTDDYVFGYNEAWAEYRYMPNTVAGQLRPDSGTPLTAWTYTNDFSSGPTLSPEFIYENPSNIDRTLAVSSSVSDQFIVDFYFDLTVTRPMPLYSIPGLVDRY